MFGSFATGLLNGVGNTDFLQRASSMAARMLSPETYNPWTDPIFMKDMQAAGSLGVGAKDNFLKQYNPYMTYQATGPVRIGNDQKWNQLTGGVYQDPMVYAREAMKALNPNSNWDWMPNSYIPLASFKNIMGQDPASIAIDVMLNGAKVDTEKSIQNKNNAEANKTNLYNNWITSNQFDLGQFYKANGVQGWESFTGKMVPLGYMSNMNFQPGTLDLERGNLQAGIDLKNSQAGVYDWQAKTLEGKYPHEVAQAAEQVNTQKAETFYKQTQAQGILDLIPYQQHELYTQAGANTALGDQRTAQANWIKGRPYPTTKGASNISSVSQTPHEVFDPYFFQNPNFTPDFDKIDLNAYGPNNHNRQQQDKYITAQPQTENYTPVGASTTRPDGYTPDYNALGPAIYEHGKKKTPAPMKVTREVYNSFLVAMQNLNENIKTPEDLISALLNISDAKKPYVGALLGKWGHTPESFAQALAEFRSNY